ncbi:hypothetical protein PENTCL1PPCAC_13457 [Pristionchus entomophagus]|uniref:Thioredoxin domain-containing protein n=1 Tax=Pristionchus entomophagus TaxID=358040 RepID=A0AAV5T8N2_9BILA|nr:hypothetical protein PENTCL1PPCAC_13457 [Pristionchus entomophagus]
MASLFAGAKLYRNGGGQESVSVLEGKTLGIYFSAHWCPPCRAFTPLLKDFYDELVEENAPFEIVFMSSDKDEATLKKYLEEVHGDWYYIGRRDKVIG